jgi:hypothetical protein
VSAPVQASERFSLWQGRLQVEVSKEQWLFGSYYAWTMQDLEQGDPHTVSGKAADSETLRAEIVTAAFARRRELAA